MGVLDWSFNYNTDKQITDTLNEQMQSLSASSLSSMRQTQGITITNTAGDVNIGGVSMDETAQVSMSAVLKQMGSQQAMQKIAQDAAQKAKALNKGLDVGNLSVGVNSVDHQVRATSQMGENLQSSCDDKATQEQHIRVDKTGGNVNVKNVSMSQSMDMVSKCVQNQTANNSYALDVQQTAKQIAASENEGLFSGPLGSIIIAIIIIMVLGGGGFALKKKSSSPSSAGSPAAPLTQKSYIGRVLGISGIIFILTGIILCILYSTQAWSNAKLKLYRYSKTIAKSSCAMEAGTEKAGSVTKEYNTIEDAVQAFEKNGSFVAFDWEPYVVGHDENTNWENWWQQIKKGVGYDETQFGGKTQFYSKVSELPCKDIQGTIMPSSINGPGTGSWGPDADKPYSMPANDKGKGPVNTPVLDDLPTGWSKDEDGAVPPIVGSALGHPWSGFKEPQYNPVYLGVGIPLIILGIAGVIYGFMPSKRK